MGSCFGRSADKLASQKVEKRHEDVIQLERLTQRKQVNVTGNSVRETRDKKN